MKNWRKAILVLLCLSMILSTTGCGMGNDTSKDNTNQTNDATDHTGEDGVINDMGNAVGDSIDDVGNAVGDGVKDITDDVTGNNNRVSEERNNTTN